MAIRVRHEAPLEVAGQLAAGIGQAQGAQQGLALDADRMKFLLGMAENQRQFDVNTQLKLDQNAQDQQRYYAGLAQQSARQRALLFDQQQRRQAEQAAQQMQGEQQFFMQQQEQMFQQAMEGAKSIDEQLKDQIKRANEMQLTPEGQRLKNEWMGKVRQAQAQRGTLRPDAYQNVLAQAMQQYEDLGLDAYTVKEPTIDERWTQQTRTDEDGAVYGLDRSGNFRKLKDPPPKPLTPELIAASTTMLPNNLGAIFVHPHTGKETYIPPKKEEKPEEEKPLLPATDRDTFYNSVREALRKEWESGHTEKKNADGSTTETPPEGLSFREYLRKYKDEEVQIFNEMFGEQDTETLVPDEVRAKMPGAPAEDEIIVDEQRNQSRRPHPFESDAIGYMPEVTQPQPVEVASREEVENLQPGSTFILAGQLYRWLGNGQVEPINMQ